MSVLDVETNDLKVPHDDLVMRPALDMLRLELAFRFEDVGWLPPFRGSLWRGVLGPALKHLDVQGSWQPPQTVPGSLPGSLYDWVFETSPGICLLKPQNGALPHPLIIDAPPEAAWQFVEPGKTLRIQLTLVGRFACAWQAIIAAFQNAAQNGLGRAITREGQRGRAVLLSVHHVWMNVENTPRPLWNAETGWGGEQARPIFLPPPEACPVRITLATPLRVKRQGRVVRPDQFGPADLFAPLIRRVAALMASEEGVRLNVDFRALTDLAGQLAMHNTDLHWQDAKRWSASQANDVPMGGIIGSFDVDFYDTPELFDFLWLAQWINIGKGAFMGMGSIRLQPL